MSYSNLSMLRPVGQCWKGIVALLVVGGAAAALKCCQPPSSVAPCLSLQRTHPFRSIFCFPVFAEMVP